MKFRNPTDMHIKKKEKFKFVLRNKTNIYPISIETLTEAILSKMSGINKWRRDFLSHLFQLFLSMRGRYTFLKDERYGNFGEISYRQHFECPRDWVEFNYHLIIQSSSAEHINVFDPSYLSKNGRHTPGVGWMHTGLEHRQSLNRQFLNPTVIGIC